MVPIIECPVCGGVMIPGNIHRCPISGTHPVDQAYLNSRYFQETEHQCAAVMPRKPEPSHE